jgi:hypothetical protein
MLTLILIFAATTVRLWRRMGRVKSVVVLEVPGDGLAPL